MSAFLDSQAAQQHLLTPSPCPEVSAWRTQAMAQALRVGFPHNKLERWKYTPLRPLAQKSYPAERAGRPAIDPALLPSGQRIVFVNGRFRAEHTRLDDMPGLQVLSLADALAGDDARRVAFLGRQFSDVEAPFAALNTALAEQGILISVEEQAQIDPPLHLVFLGNGSTGSAYLRHRIECRAGSRLTLIEHHLSQDGDAGLGNHLMHIHLGVSAGLRHVRIQQRDTAAVGFCRHDAVLASQAEYQRLDIETGSHLSRLELNLCLQGEQAYAHAGGVLWSTGTGTLDTRLTVRHQAPNTQCRLVWRGMADDRARVNFHGGIHIEKGADGADAALSNKNLLLGRQAQVNTQPVLEIHADEVKAAHGATVGQLDHTALFYLRSRGIPQAQAEKLLSQAFYAEAFEGLADTALMHQLQDVLPAILRRDQETQP